jgi:hypothetical protein
MSHTTTPDLPSVELPPLPPEPTETVTFCPSEEKFTRTIGYSAEHMQDFARAAVLADRAQRMEAAAQGVPSGLQALLAEAREAIEPLTEAQIRLHRIRRDLADRIDAALSASPAAALEKPDSEVAEALIAACVPGGDTCDPQRVADAIREWFAAAPAEHAKGVRVALTDERIREVVTAAGLQFTAPDFIVARAIERELSGLSAAQGSEGGGRG